MNGLLHPTRLWSRQEALTPGVVPRSPGVYAWWFREIPPAVPTDGCVVHDELTLLYVGIAPSAPPVNGRRPSKATLRSRLRQHMAGNAYGSTLRLTLGCLLSKQLGIELRRVGAGDRLTFAKGEAKLNEWLGANAFVSWIQHDRPWELESAIIASTSLPLNLSQNKAHPFCATLSACRGAARARARELPLVAGTPRTAR